MADGEDEDANLFPKRVGERLRDARVAAGLDVSDIANRTRVPQRMLEAIEASDYAAMPTATYSIGFAKAHARAVGLSEVDIARALRAEMVAAGTGSARRTELQPYEPADPARVPTRLLAWTAAAIAVLILVAYGVWRSELLSGGAKSDADQAVEAVIAGAQPATGGPAVPHPVAPQSGAVVLTAIEPVWMRVYDGTGKRLFEKEMAAGERYEVPGDAVNPQIMTGRPQALSVTVGGAPVPPLGEPDKRIKDVAISAAALAARGAPAPAATPATAVAPAPPVAQPLMPPPQSRPEPQRTPRQRTPQAAAPQPQPASTPTGSTPDTAPAQPVAPPAGASTPPPPGQP